MVVLGYDLPKMKEELEEAQKIAEKATLEASVNKLELMDLRDKWRRHSYLMATKQAELTATTQVPPVLLLGDEHDAVALTAVRMTHTTTSPLPTPLPSPPPFSPLFFRLQAKIEFQEKYRIVRDKCDALRAELEISNARGDQAVAIIGQAGVRLRCVED